jgi:AraC-like DNA-binding protein/mannose-6-phosphate isomerase-like protein (cupin superfamily)
MQHIKIETDAQGRELAQHGSLDFPCGTYDEYFSQFFNEEVPWHWHEEIEVVLVAEGATLVQCVNQERVISQGEMVFINANALHRLTRHSEEECHILNVVFSPKLLTGHLLGTIYQKHILPILQSSELQMVTFSPEVSWQRQCIQTMQEAFEHWHKEHSDKEFVLQMALMKLWHLLASNIKLPYSKSKNTTQQERRIQAALEFIQQHYRNTISVYDICNAANISESEGYRLFRNLLNSTPTAYLTEYRLRMAAQTLIQTKQPISQIAYDTGFNCPAYFAKKFRQQYGSTPKAFRQQPLKPQL